MGKTHWFHMQLSVDAARFGPEYFDRAKCLELDGLAVSGEEVVKYLKELKATGFKVVPCGCPGSEKPPGYCPGF